QAEEQRTIEARIHAEQEELMRQVKERNARETSAAVAAASEASSSANAYRGGGGGGGDGGAEGADSSVMSAHSLPARASFATVAERRLTEEQIRNQHVPAPPGGSSRSLGAGASR
ncbi:unnamed protein product, partial [Laminaria digitata]